eukprot:TRINITY_DN6680_c3_g1_i2.p1 TRINITY_DN6680_c3_g1~~TRINITY_DN6680_c3_g1_i2.p1  ORF type:complete len:283 (+),score=73.20 TRINITY_DN6680_c3_g1_i2:213-1061(+)
MDNCIQGKGFSYEKLILINKGTYGDVYKAKQRPSGKTVILKRIDKYSCNTKRIEGEIEAGRKLNGVKGIPRFHHYFESPNSFWLVFDYIRGDNLFQKLEKRGEKPFSEDVVRKILKDLVQILEQTHSKGIAHKDIKLENIMWNRSTKKLNLLDFGLCFQFDKTDTCNDFGGSAEYCPPEILFGFSNFSATLCDVWALGVVIFIMAFGVFPFAYDEKEDEFTRETGMHPPPNFPELEGRKTSNSLVDLLKKMMEIDPSKRIRVKEILEHPFMRKRTKVLKIKT